MPVGPAGRMMWPRRSGVQPPTDEAARYGSDGGDELIEGLMVHDVFRGRIARCGCYCGVAVFCGEGWTSACNSLPSAPRMFEPQQYAPVWAMAHAWRTPTVTIE